MADLRRVAAGDSRAVLVDVRVDETRSEDWRRLVGEGFSGTVRAASLPVAWRRPGVVLKVRVSR
jgi:hypothetical protein